MPAMGGKWSLALRIGNVVGHNDQRDVMVTVVCGKGFPAYLNLATDRCPQHLIQRLGAAAYLYPSKSLVRVGELAAVIQTNGMGQLH